MKKYIIACILSLVLFVVSYLFLAGPISVFAISMLGEGNFYFVALTPQSMLHEQLLYSLPIALLPLLYLVVDYFGKVTTTRQRILSIALMLLCGVSAFIVRIMMIQSALTYQISPEVQNTVSLGSLKFHQALLMGVIAGAVIAIMVFRSAHRRQQQTETEGK